MRRREWDCYGRRGRTRVWEKIWTNQILALTTCGRKTLTGIAFCVNEMSEPGRLSARIWHTFPKWEPSHSISHLQFRSQKLLFYNIGFYHSCAIAPTVYLASLWQCDLIEWLEKTAFAIYPIGATNDFTILARILLLFLTKLIGHMAHECRRLTERYREKVRLERKNWQENCQLCWYD